MSGSAGLIPGVAAAHHGTMTGQGITVPEKNVAEAPGDTDRKTDSRQA
jgi:hypothetical protein